MKKRCSSVLVLTLGSLFLIFSFNFVCALQSYEVSIPQTPGLVWTNVDMSLNCTILTPPLLSSYNPMNMPGTSTNLGLLQTFFNLYGHQSIYAKSNCSVILNSSSWNIPSDLVWSQVISGGYSAAVSSLGLTQNVRYYTSDKEILFNSQLGQLNYSSQVPYSVPYNGGRVPSCTSPFSIGGSPLTYSSAPLNFNTYPSANLPGYNLNTPCPFALYRFVRCQNESIHQCINSTNSQFCSNGNVVNTNCGVKETCDGVSGFCGCNPGDKKCVGDGTIAVCNSSGYWDSPVSCGSGITCTESGNSASCNYCTLGAKQCLNGAFLSTCNEQGSWNSSSCSSGTECIGDSCQATCNAQGGDICADDERCKGSKLDASDSDRCCSTACVPDTMSSCGDCGTGWFNICHRQECENFINIFGDGCTFTPDGFPLSLFGAGSCVNSNLACTGGNCNNGAVQHIDNCSTLDKQGTTYVLDNDVSVSGDCFKITGNDVTLEGNGHTLTGDFGLDPSLKLIYTCRDLQNITNDLNSSYVLINDIDCSDTVNWNNGAGFVPIGNSTTQFGGNFNGNNKTIFNLIINNPQEDYTGLFGYSLGSIFNVGLVDVNINGGSFTGSLAGFSGGSINNSYSTGNLVGSSAHVGGLVGYQSGGIISNAYSLGTVNGFVGVDWGAAGGLVGSQYGGIISNSYSAATVIGGYAFDIGGLVGYQDTPSLISNSYSTGTLVKGVFNTGSTYFRTIWSGTNYLVGISSRGVVSNSYPLNFNNSYTIDYFRNKTNQPMATWDFDNFWAINSNVNNGDPYLSLSNNILTYYLNPASAILIKNAKTTTISNFSSFLNFSRDLYVIDSSKVGIYPSEISGYSFTNSTLIFESNNSKIEYLEPISSSPLFSNNLSDVVNISRNNLDVNTNLEPGFNRRARLYYNFSLPSNSIIRYNGNILNQPNSLFNVVNSIPFTMDVRGFDVCNNVVLIGASCMSNYPGCYCQGSLYSSGCSEYNNYASFVQIPFNCPSSFAQSPSCTPVYDNLGQEVVCSAGKECVNNLCVQN